MPTNTLIPPARQDFHVMAKPIGPLCNIECAYCFYLPKKALFPENQSFRMSEAVLESFTRQYIQAQPPGTPGIDFTWQGGEPTLMEVDFFRKAVKYQQKYARPGMVITNSLQTNGTLLNDEWGRFLHEYDFLVGISIDGPDWIHNKFRKNRKGEDTFDSVMAGLEQLKKHDVKYNVLTCVQDHNSYYPVEVYDFFVDIGATFLQFIPVVEKEIASGAVSSRSVKPEMYGSFMNGVLDRWLEKGDVGKIFVRDFDVTLGLVMGLPSSICIHAETCGRSVVVEHTGEMFSCDHFVTKENLIGNVLENTMPEMLDGSRQTSFGMNKWDALPRNCLDCEFVTLCNGGCPKDRIIDTPDGESGLNYLCEGFKAFYRHSIPVFEKMADCIRLGRPACDYERINQMSSTKAESSFKNVGRNDPCPCGSGKKFKKCCGP